MDQDTRKFILDVLDRAQDLTLATIRPDGYPQATTVSFAHDGLDIYVAISATSQKAENIRRCDKVSLSIDTDYSDWNHIQGLSMGANAEILSDAEQIRHAGELLMKRFPQVKEWAGTARIADFAFLKIRPKIISVLNYEKGFGHTETVPV
jgi:nitroimidazol reductase NimA-like FMN-containing flavoprotein (pyridoxamine 5'-phosphate oxidase superfamily)